MPSCWLNMPRMQWIWHFRDICMSAIGRYRPFQPHKYPKTVRFNAYSVHISASTVAGGCDGSFNRFFYVLLDKIGRGNTPCASGISAWVTSLDNFAGIGVIIVQMCGGSTPVIRWMDNSISGTIAIIRIFDIWSDFAVILENYYPSSVWITQCALQSLGWAWKMENFY